MIKISEGTIINGRAVDAVLKQVDKNDVAHPKIVVILNSGLALQSALTYEETIQAVEQDVLAQVFREGSLMTRATQALIHKDLADGGSNNDNPIVDN